MFFKKKQTDEMEKKVDIALVVQELRLIRDEIEFLRGYLFATESSLKGAINENTETLFDLVELNLKEKKQD